MFEGAQVICSDEYAKLPYLVSQDELIAESEIIIVGAPHSSYKSIEFPKQKRLVDVWNIINRGNILFQQSMDYPSQSMI